MLLTSCHNYIYMEPTLEQLKGAAYDLIVSIEQSQERLRQVNHAIANFKQEEVKEEPKEKEEAQEKK